MASQTAAADPCSQQIFTEFANSSYTARASTAGVNAVRTIGPVAKMLKRVGLAGLALMVTGLVVRVSPALTHERVAGIASVIDGDTLLVGGTRVRLDGIDAPEGRQICKKSHRPWSCGQAARVALERLVAGR
jgi:endonuclease YncB( thermonuclease family)